MAQGCAAIFNGILPLKMKESENHIFRFPCSENPRMELFRASLKIEAYISFVYNLLQTSRSVIDAIHLIESHRFDGMLGEAYYRHPCV